jgi:hypothetical protein
MDAVRNTLHRPYSQVCDFRASADHGGVGAKGPLVAAHGGGRSLELCERGSHRRSFTRTPFVKSRKDRFRNITESI